MPLLISAVVIMSVATALMLVYYLVSVIQALRSITGKLANVRILLLTVASQTQPAGDLVGGVGSNVNSLHELVTGVARSLGLSAGGSR